MKKLVMGAVVMAVLTACGGEREPLDYRGLSMDMPFGTFCDSLKNRGFVMDSAKSDTATGKTVVMAKAGEKYRLMLAQQDGKIVALQENYTISTNDSTRRLWQEIRDAKEKEMGWPNCPILKDDHKVAKFEAEGGFITVTLENTYTPTLQVLYQVK